MQYSWVTASDKYVYAPAIGLLMILAWGLGWAWKNLGSRVETVRPIVVAIVLVLLCGGSTRCVAVCRAMARLRDALSAHADAGSG